MALTKERKAEISLIFLKKLLEKEGIQLKPNETRRSVLNMAKKLQISEVEAAEFIMEMTTKFYNETMEKLQIFVTGEKTK